MSNKCEAKIALICKRYGLGYRLHVLNDVDGTDAIFREYNRLGDLKYAKPEGEVDKNETD